MPSFVHPLCMYRGPLYSAQNIVKKDPSRARQKSLATAGTNFTKPGAHNKGDLCKRVHWHHVCKCETISFDSFGIEREFDFPWEGAIFKAQLLRGTKA